MTSEFEQDGTWWKCIRCDRQAKMIAHSVRKIAGTPSEPEGRAIEFTITCPECGAQESASDTT